MTRLDYNRKILEIVIRYLVQNPDMRLGQALYNLNIATHRKNPEDKADDVAGYKELFYEESAVTLSKIRQL